ILTTDPAKIISGGNITINGQTINNDNSQIIAGQRLAITAQQLNNISTIGERRITRSGTRKYSAQYKEKGSRGTKTYTRHTNYKYNPADEVYALDLANAALEQYAHVKGNNIAAGERQEIKVTVEREQQIVA